MELTRLIPSCYIRDELRKNGFQLSDAEKSNYSLELYAFIYRKAGGATKAERQHQAMKICKKQIRERLDFENQKLERIKDNSSGSYLYVFEDQYKLCQNYF